LSEEVRSFAIQTILSFIAIRVGGPMLGPIRGRGARIPGQRSVLQGNK